MRRLLRFAVATVGGLLIVVGVAVLLLSSHAARFVKPAVERRLTEVFGTQTTMDSIAFSPIKGAVAIRGLAVINPEPFKGEPALRFGRIEIQCDPQSMLTRNPTVRQVLLEDGQVSLRYELGRGTNLGVLAKHAAEFAEAQKARKGTRSFIIEKLECKPTKVELSSNILPGAALPLNLVSFTRTDLSKESPVTPPQMAAIVIRSLLTEILTVKGILTPVATRLKEELQELVD